MSNRIKYSDFLRDLNKSLSKDLSGQEATLVNVKTLQLNACLGGYEYTKPKLYLKNGKWVLK